MKNKIILFLSIIVIASLIAWKLSDNKQQINEEANLSLVKNTVIPIRVSPVEQRHVNKRIQVDGLIQAQNEVTIYSKANGLVLKKNKKAGDLVQKGTRIAQVENYVEKEVIRLAEQNIAKLGKDVERYKRLAGAGAVTQREYEEVLINYREAQRILTDLREQLKNTIITSPITGILDKDYFEEGILLSPGDKVADIVDATGLKLILNITERDVHTLKKNDQVQIITNSFPNENFEGLIDVISLRNNESLGYQTEVKLIGKNASKLKPGMYATGVLNESNMQDKTFVIEKKAIIESLKNPEVYVIKGNRAVRRAIVTGKTNDQYIEVLQGLEPADQVVVSGQINLTDNCEISIIK